VYEEFDGQFWVKKNIVYVTEDKGMVDEVRIQWFKDFSNKKVELTSITYC